MRPTNIGFRSPKEKTGEFVIPETNYLGKSMNLIRRTTMNRDKTVEE
jgi:hypothetical protein